MRVAIALIALLAAAVNAECGLLCALRAPVAKHACCDKQRGHHETKTCLNTQTPAAALAEFAGAAAPVAAGGISAPVSVAIFLEKASPWAGADSARSTFAPLRI